MKTNIDRTFEETVAFFKGGGSCRAVDVLSPVIEGYHVDLKMEAVASHPGARISKNDRTVRRMVRNKSVQLELVVYKKDENGDIPRYYILRIGGPTCSIQQLKKCAGEFIHKVLIEENLEAELILREL